MGEIVSELWTFHAALIFKDNRSLWIDLPWRGVRHDPTKCRKQRTQPQGVLRFPGDSNPRVFLLCVLRIMCIHWQVFGECRVFPLSVGFNSRTVERVVIEFVTRHLYKTLQNHVDISQSIANEIFLFSKTPRLAMEPTKLPVNRCLGSFPGV
jgi:hypothetical protein